VRSEPGSTAYVIGSGPNGLTAAIELARAGIRTTVLEAADTIGGGARSAELTLPGFIHDVCSAVHPMAVCSPVFASFPLAQHGLEWIQPEIPVAHPLDDGSAAVLYRSLDETCVGLGADAIAYRRALGEFSRNWSDLSRELLQPIQHVPKRPFLLARFGMRALQSGVASARRLFGTERARALWAGLCAHSILPLEAAGTGAFGYVLASAAHATGWPIARGGSQRIVNALAAYFEILGGRIVTKNRVASLSEIPVGSLILCDVTPRQLLALSENRLPEGFQSQLRAYQYGPGSFKMDWALSEPIPWRASECRRAGTVHIGGTLDEIAASERSAWQGEPSEHPFVILVQPTLFDSARAPQNRHTAWAYCHVPNGSTTDMRERIEQQIERFAPGFRDCILARSAIGPAGLEQYNANMIGGDILGGAHSLKQLLFRPTRILYRTPLSSVYLCSSSTPPGGGVHGMCGFNAARVAFRAAGVS
jgi:phytoene dehydrogenase-like protein